MDWGCFILSRVPVVREKWTSLERTRYNKEGFDKRCMENSPLSRKPIMLGNFSLKNTSYEYYWTGQVTTALLYLMIQTLRTIIILINYYSNMVDYCWHWQLPKLQKQQFQAKSTSNDDEFCNVNSNRCWRIWWRHRMFSYAKPVCRPLAH